MSIYAVDIDGTLCETSRTWLEPTDDPERSVIHFPHPAPIQRNIDAVNKLVAAGHIIILHTSRTGNYDRERTVDWLDCHEVSYHRIHFDKPLADFYVDDKAWSADSFAFEVGVTDAARDREGIRGAPSRPGSSPVAENSSSYWVDDDEDVTLPEIPSAPPQNTYTSSLILSELRHERDRQRTLELRYSVAMDRALALDAPMIADANRVGRDACGAKACIIDRAISLYLQSAS